VLVQTLARSMCKLLRTTMTSGFGSTLISYMSKVYWKRADARH
jgi:hypothetical protein